MLEISSTVFCLQCFGLQNEEEKKRRRGGDNFCDGEEKTAKAIKRVYLWGMTSSQ